MSQSERDDLEFALKQAFRPSTPINREDLFQGRRDQVSAVVNAINQHGRHVVVYGERGVGKTSLANMIALNLRGGRSILAPHINCTSIKQYSELWDVMLTEIGYLAEKNKLMLPSEVKDLLHQIGLGLSQPIDQQKARLLIAKLAERHSVVLIFDEFDALEDLDARLAMSETIKLFSDRNVGATIVLVGVAEDIPTLVEGHLSIERCISQVKMPRMSRDEVEEIVEKTLATKSIKMTVDMPSLHEISRIAKGLPHYAHQLGLNAALEAVKFGERKVQRVHVEAGIEAAMHTAQASILNAYQKAITSTKKALYKEVLLACALADCDQFGFFSPTSVKSPLAKILGRHYKLEAFARHLHAFCSDERGPVLTKADLPGRNRFRFANPLVEPFVLLKGISDKLLTQKILEETRDKGDSLRLF